MGIFEDIAQLKENPTKAVNYILNYDSQSLNTDDEIEFAAALGKLVQFKSFDGAKIEELVQEGFSQKFYQEVVTRAPEIEDKFRQYGKQVFSLLIDRAKLDPHNTFLGVLDLLNSAFKVSDYLGFEFYGLIPAEPQYKNLRDSIFSNIGQEMSPISSQALGYLKIDALREQLFSNLDNLEALMVKEESKGFSFNRDHIAQVSIYSSQIYSDLSDISETLMNSCKKNGLTEEQVSDIYTALQFMVEYIALESAQINPNDLPDLLINNYKSYCVLGGRIAEFLKNEQAFQNKEGLQRTANQLIVDTVGIPEFNHVSQEGSAKDQYSLKMQILKKGIDNLYGIVIPIHRTE